MKRELVALPELWRWSSFRTYFLAEAGPVAINRWEVLKMKIRPRPRKKPKGSGGSGRATSRNPREVAHPQFWLELYFAGEGVHPPTITAGNNIGQRC